MTPTRPAAGRAVPAPDEGLGDEDLLRYSRHLLLDDVGIEGQARFGAAHALVVGVGGLGSPVALFLASAGLGRLTLVDDDTVSLTNLQRQIAHDTTTLGSPKVRSAAQAIARLNPRVAVQPVEARADRTLLDALVPAADVVLDCSDNYATRQLLNAACVRHARPLVSGAAIAFDGQVAVYDTRDPACPCYACVFPPEPAGGATVPEVACATLGVFAPLVGIIGSLQAAEALKLVAAVGTPLAGRLLMLDARTMAWTDLQTARDPACPVCADRRC